ncbi:hypothetical protein TNCV_2525941 [Trichonephila clavipes]|nr:hypothetical protein TNCV_2525941 [Trichonephila clavipes]
MFLSELANGDYRLPFLDETSITLLPLGEKLRGVVGRLEGAKLKPKRKPLSVTKCEFRIWNRFGDWKCRRRQRTRS